MPDRPPSSRPVVYAVTDGKRDYLTVDGTVTDNAWFCVTSHWPRRVRIMNGHEGPVIAEGVLPGGEGPLWLTGRTAAEQSSWLAKAAVGSNE